MSPPFGLIVIGASSGGVEALKSLAARLPAGFPVPIIAVLHLASWVESHLAGILSSVGPLRARQPSDDELLEPGAIYVPRPDFHLIVEDGHMHHWRGPKENRHRPAINALFRSAAVSFGPGTIGVVLTGSLDDGATGLWWVKRHGGIAVVQDPHDAEAPEMPQSALATVEVDHVVTLDELPDLLVRLVTNDETRETGKGGESHGRQARH
jgi:two-component system chemotaxis response regulator CheB